MNTLVVYDSQFGNTEQIAQAIAASPELSARCDLLCSMPGVGPVVAATLLALLPELGSLPNRSIAALATIKPSTSSSRSLRMRQKIRFKVNVGF